MFVLNKKGSYSWPVVVEFPVDGGKFDKQNFDAEFKLLPQSRIDEIFQQASEGKLMDSEIAPEILMGWKGINDENGAVPYSEEAKERVLDIPFVRAALISAFLKSLKGSEASRGN